MATIYGGKVKEPKVTRRSTLPVEKKAAYAEDLAQAWASFGQAKSVLQKLETVTGSPPLKKQRKNKPYSVRFETQNTRVDNLSSMPDNPHTRSGMSCDVGGKENQYVVEPELLNRRDTSAESESVLSGLETAANTNGSPPINRAEVSGRRGQPPSFHTHSQPGTSATLTSATITQYRQTSPVPRVPTTSDQFHAQSAMLSPSNPNNVGSPQTQHQPLHSNAAAVFGPAVKFNDQVAGRKPPKPTSSTSSVVSKHQYTTLAPRHHPKATPTTSYTATTAHAQSGGTGAGRYVPIRRFELPAETVGTLKAQIELQKQAVRASSAKMDSLNTGHGFYPLPEASTATNSFSSTGVDPHTHLQPHPPPKYSYSKRTGITDDYLTSGAVKKRKVASAPPPQSYVGFSSAKPSALKHTSSSHGASTATHGPAQWQPNLERLGKGLASSATRTLSTKARDVVGGTSSTQQHGGRVRKVHRFSPDVELPGATKSAPLPRTSWSTQTTRVNDRGSKSKQPQSPSPTDVISDTQSSMDLSSHSAISNVSSSISLPVKTELSTNTAGRSFRRGASKREREEREESVSAERKAGLTVNVAKLLEDLETSGVGVSDDKDEDGGQESDPHRPKRHVPGATGGGGGTAASKKPRCNYEPVYPTEKVRHYDQSEVQSYIQKKQEERRRKAHEDQLSQERAAKERQEKLRKLYDTQRKKVETNLRLKKKQRETYSRALASGVHIHLHCTASSSSEALDDSIPSLTVNPTSPRLHSQMTTGTYRTSQSTAPTMSHTLHPSPPSHSPKYTSQSHRLSPHTSPRSHASDHTPPPSHTFHPSPPRHPPPAYTSPLRYGHLDDQNIPTRVYSSAARTNYRRGHSQSPQAQPTFSTYSPSHYVHVRTTTVQSQMGFDAGTHSQFTGSTTPGKLSSHLRGADHTTEVSNTLKTREDRITALTQSALRLKDRIATETRRLEEGLQPQDGSVHHPSTSTGHARPPYQHQVGEMSRGHSGDLPGVQNIREHALQAERQHRESQAATKIQAAYRGYSLRKSLQWKLPSGRTLGSALRRKEAGTEGVILSDGMVSPVVDTPMFVTGSKGAKPAVSEAPPRSVPLFEPPAQFYGVPPPTTKVEPWAQTGGDSHSVINIFTRQHEKLKETLNQLSDQKRAEIRRLGEDGRLAHHLSDIPPPHSEAESELSHQKTPEAAYSYTESFEPSSSKSNVREEESFDAGSRISTPFSQDSLSERTPTLSEKFASESETTRDTHSHTGTQLSQTNKQAPRSPANGEQEIHAITPPGSPSFVNSFTSQTPQQSATHTRTPDASKQTYEPAAAPPLPSGHLSPRSLELKLQAELNLLDTAEESMRQLSHMENTRAVSLAQQETVTLAQLLKSRQQNHEREMESLSSRAQQDVERAQKKFESETALASKKMRDLQQEMDTKVKEQTERFAQLRQESAQVTQEVTKQMQDAQSAATTAMMESAQQQLQAAQTIAVSVASTAAQKAIKAAFERVELKSSRDKHNVSETVPSYESDFEPSTIQPDSLAELKTEGTYHPSKPPPSTSTESRASSSPIEESLTPTTSEGKEGDDTLVAEDESYRSSSPQEELEDDISEVSFRELLPSESHRRQQVSRHQRGRASSESDDTRSLLGDISRSHTPTLGEQSPFSPGGEDSFFQFMNHMVQSYMHEEELRSRHQQALLQLREKALEEKTKAELDWIKLKKRDLQSKGADDQMPPLVKREKGLLRKLQHEQSEIRKLQEAQRAASHERKLMVLQQKEITKMRRSTQYYRDKIHKYRQNAHPSRTPSPFPSLDESVVSQVADESGSEHSVAEELSEMVHGSSAPPSEHLEHSLPVEQQSYSVSFPTYTPSDQVTTQPTSVSDLQTPEASEIKSPSRTSPARVTGSPSVRTSRTPTSETMTLKKLKKFTSADAERYHTKREQSLIKRRQAAEEALKYHEKLLKKEHQLDQEEEEVNCLVTKAVKCISQHPKLPPKREKKPAKTEEDMTDQRQPVDGLPVESSPPPHFPAGTRSATASVSEHISVSASVAEEILATSKGDQSTVIHTEQSASAKVPSEYEGDTFESLDTTLTHPHHPPITTSTPDRPSQEQDEVSQQERFDDISFSDSLKITSSIDSVTTTSEASVIEARIRLLKEQLRQRKEEVKRVQSEQKRKKKALLKQQEEQLKRKLEAIENRAKRVLMSPPPRSTTSPSISTTSSIASRTQSERSESEMSREQSISPLMVSHPPFLQLPDDADTKRMADETVEQLQNMSQGSFVEEQVSPVTSPTYTPFTDSVGGSLKDETETQIQVKIDEKELPAGTHFPVARDTMPQELPIEDGVDQQTRSVSEDTIVTEEDDKAPSVQETRVAEEAEEGQTIELTQDKVDSSPVSSIAEQLSEQLEDGSLVSAADGLKPSEETNTQEKEPHYTESFEEPSSVPEPPVKKPSAAESQQETAEVSTDAPKTDVILTTESTESLPISLSGSHGGDSEEQGNYSIGQRVLVGNVMAGTIKFIGHTHFAQGLWIGVEIDLPKGRNDGSIDEQHYFLCKPKHGVFAPPNKVSPLVVEEEEDGSSVAEELDSDHELEEGEKKSVDQTASYDERSHSISPKHDKYSPDFVSSSEESQDEQQHYYEHLGDNTVASHPSKADKHHTDSNTEDLEESVSEQPAPASEMFNNLGEKPESMPLAPEVMNQRSQSATPTPAPPPEFAEGASRESSIEPPFSLEDEIQSTYRLSTELITDELAQELTNEAFETMHKIWKAKHAGQAKRQQVSHVMEAQKKPAEVVVVAKDKDVALTLDDKVDRITDHLLALLLQSESTVMCNIHSSKKSSEDKQIHIPAHEEGVAKVKAPRPRPPPLEDFPAKKDIHVQTTSPTKRGPPGQLILSPIGFTVESSPPPLSPPSPYRLSPPPLGVSMASEYSPPGSPPRHLSQTAAARVAAGEKTPYLSGAHHDGTPVSAAQKKPSVLERSASVESISQLLDSIKLTTAQCMVPSDRESVNEVVEHAWIAAKSINPDVFLSSSVCCPNEVLDLFKNVRELSLEEEHCRVAYLKLVFDLSVAIIKSMHPTEEPLPVWLKECSVNTQLAQKHKNSAELSLETVQNKVYAALIRGQLPAQLPSVKFLYGMKRPGGREIDFVDTILIKELREEEPSWVNYTEDETAVKLRTADSILDSLISETVEILSHIKHKRQPIEAPS